MALNPWSKRSLIIAAAICLTGGFLIGSSSSQDVRRRADESDVAAPSRRKEGPEIGRYQMVGGPGAKIIFDTVTARYWQEANYSETGESRWIEHAAPWTKRQQ
jgi:hypothetical protein